MDTGQRIYRFCCYDLSSVGCGDQISDTHWLWSARPEQCGQLLSWVRLQQHSGGGAGDPSTIYTTNINPSASQLQLPSSYNGTKCHDIVQIVSMSTHNIQHNPTEPSQWWAWQRAGPGSAANPAAPRPAPARPGPSTAPDTAFRFHCPPRARPSPAAAPCGSRTPHSHDPTYPAVRWLATMQSPPGPSRAIITPCSGCGCRRRGGGGALLEAAQPPPGHRSAGQGGPGPALAAHNNSPTTAERENPRRNTIRTTFAHLTHHNLGRGHSRAGWARLGSLHCLGRDIFWSLAQSLKHSPVSRCRGAALGFAGLTAGTAAA